MTYLELKEKLDGILQIEANAWDKSVREFFVGQSVEDEEK